MYADLLVEIRDEVAFLTIHRPEKLNALRIQTIEELENEMMNGRNKKKTPFISASKPDDYNKLKNDFDKFF